MTDPGAETQISGAITSVPPIPRYEDEDAEALGEALAELYARRDENPRAKVATGIEEARRSLRRGPRLRAGEFLSDGRYRLLERMNERPGDATWRAWDRMGQRMVVVKEMVGVWVSRKMRVASFLESARTLQGIEHAGLATVHEADRSVDGFIFLVTDYFPNGTLNRGFSGDSTDAVQVLVEVGNALQVCHEASLLHARVTPKNIHFGHDGGARLVDFDLAGEHAQDERGGVYLAPEMAERGSHASPASDAFGLAMCGLFALNGGKLPYSVVRGPDRFIDALDVADTVKAVLKHAVQWEVGDRFASVREFVDALLADPEILRGLAERALEKHRYVIASEHYTALWALTPDDSVQIKRTLGEIYLKMQAWEEAFECLSTALQESPDPAPIFPSLREFAEGTGGWKRVADLLWNHARERNPVQRAAMRAELARITEHQLDDAQGAAEIWTLVVQDHRLPARGAEAFTALTRLARAREDWSAMVDHSQDLLPYLPEEERGEVQYAIGRAYVRRLHNDDAGLRWLDKAEAAGIQPLDMAGELQEIRARRGQWRRVIGLMRLEADHEPNVHAASKILLRAATIARAVHLDAEAEAIYENMLERAPQHFPALRALARMRLQGARLAQARESYAKLTSNYLGRSDAPEARERAADHAAYATLLLDAGDHAAALVQLEAALVLQPDNVEALQLAGPLYIDLGKLERAAAAADQMFALFRAVNTGGPRLEAAIQRAQAAWYRGRLALAMRWYNTVIDTLSQDSDAWWGLAKIALASRGGHPGAERAAWIQNIPDRFTPQEGLARLFMGLFGAEAMGTWLSAHPLGAALVAAGGTAARCACAMVDLLQRYAQIDDALFVRLREAYPSWQRRIDAVETLWSHDPSFRFPRTYRWSRAAIQADFEVTAHRQVLPAGLPAHGRVVERIGTDEQWANLIGSPQPEEPPAGLPDPATSATDVEPSSGVHFVLEESVEFDFRPGQAMARVGSAPEAEWCVKGLEPEHARISRIGSSVYIERVGDAEMRVDGLVVPGWRLVGGETLQLGSFLWDVRSHAAEPAPPARVLPQDDSAYLDAREDERDLTHMAGPRAFSPDGETQPVGGLPAIPDPTWEAPLETVEGPATVSAMARVEPKREVVDGPAFYDASESAVAADEDDDETQRVIAPSLGAPATMADLSPKAEPGLDAFFDAEPEPVIEPEPEPVSEDDIEPELEPASEAEPELEAEPEPSDVEAVSETEPELEAASETEPEPEAAAEAEPDLAAATQVEPELEAGPNAEPVPDVAVADLGVEPSGEHGLESESSGSGAASPVRALPAGFDLDADPRLEDSLGPAGDAPTPQWLADQGLPDPDLTYRPGAIPPVKIAVQPSADRYSPPVVHEEAERETPAEVDEWPEEDSEEMVGIMVDASEEVEGVAEESVTQRRAHAVIEIMSGPSRGSQVEVRGVVALGRDESCEVYLPADPMLAPLHCRFVQTDDSFLIMDNGTERGTVVNGTRVSEAVLNGGETIMVGSTVLRFQVRDA